MTQLTRRRFLVASGVAGGAAALAGSTVVTWRSLQQAAATRPLPAGQQVLVVLTLYGGNDGLNTLVPYADPAYQSARPGLAYPADKVLELDAELGLNPALTGFEKLWQSGRLAIVRGVGYPKPDHSHFRSMDIWQTASPDEPVTTGWIGRWLDATGDDPLRALNLGAVLPPLAMGAKAAAAALPLGSQRTVPSALTRGLAALSTADPADSASQALVRASYAAEQRVQAGVASAASSGGTGQHPPGRSSKGSGSLADQLDLVARCITTGVPSRVYSVSQGGFDTHADELQAQQDALAAVDQAVTGFLTSMAGTAHGADVTVLVYSEFGRRVRANASQGTDHGTAGTVFVAGNRVRGGFYGDQPSLTDLDDGDLKVTTDFRAVYAELVEKVLGADPARVLGTVPGQPTAFL